MSDRQQADKWRALYQEKRDLVKELRDERDRLREALEQYGAHDPGCRFLAFKDPACTCGYSAAQR